MKKDILLPVVEGISIAVVLESEDPVSKIWNVYLINHRSETLTGVLVNSKGYGTKDDKEVKTSVLRHFLDEVPGKSFKAIEAIDEQVFGLTNEYWLSFYLGRQIYDKKFIFLPESIIDANLIRIPLVNKPGVMIGE